MCVFVGMVLCVMWTFSLAIFAKVGSWESVESVLETSLASVSTLERFAALLELGACSDTGAGDRTTRGTTGATGVAESIVYIFHSAILCTDA